MESINDKVLWPGWRTVRVIGRGSFGAVYEIERDMLGEKEKAALKLISIPQSESDIREMVSDGYDEESITNTFREHLKSIVAEYSLMRKLNGSANVVNCDDVRYVQHDDGIGWDIYIKMELLTPITDALPAEITESEAVKIAKDLCRALVQCRQFNIVHRDIKPQNIFVSPLGDYKLGDFGVAKTVEKTSGGTKIGTYKYMAPEVYHDQPYGAGADIYSLGLVLYWLMNERRLPFLPLPPEKLSTAQEEAARQRRLAGEPIPAPAHGSDAFRRVILRACSFDPKQRYRSAEEMLRELEALDPSASASAKAAPVRAKAADGAGRGGAEKGKTAGRCRNCGARLESGTKYCVSCGASQKSGGGRLTLILVGLLAALAVIAVVLIIGLGGKSGSDKTTDRTSQRAAATPAPAAEPASEPTPAPTPEPTPWVEGEWSWTLDNGTLIVSGTGNMANFENERSAPWYAQREQIRKIVVREGVTGLGSYAFNNCLNAAEVELPEGLTDIGIYAFGGCPALSSVEIPASVTHIGEGALNADNLAEIRIRQGNSSFILIDGVLYTMDRSLLLRCPPKKDVTRLRIEPGCTRIGNSALCLSPMTEIEIPSSVTSIGVCALYGCTGLTSIELPALCTDIEDYAFFGCGFTSVEIPASVVRIGEAAFGSACKTEFLVKKGNPAYTAVDGVLFTRDGKTLLNCPKSKTGVYVIPAGVTEIQPYAFNGCRSLTSIEVPAGCAAVDNYAFRYCVGITSVKLPADLQSIGYGAFLHCDSLSDVYFAGSEKQWKALDIGGSNDLLEKAAIHYNAS